MNIKDIFDNDLKMIEAVMNKMTSNDKKDYIEDNIIMCDLIVDTFSKIRDLYLEKLANKSKEL